MKNNDIITSHGHRFRVTFPDDGGWDAPFSVSVEMLYDDDEPVRGFTANGLARSDTPDDLADTARGLADAIALMARLAKQKVPHSPEADEPMWLSALGVALLFAMVFIVLAL